MATLDALPGEVVATHIVPLLQSADVSSVAHVCSRLHSLLRFERLYRLWPLYTRKYIEDVVFREEVKQHIPVGRLVLVPCEEYGVRVLRDLSAFANVHTADLRGVKITAADSSALADVHTVYAGRGFPPSRRPFSSHKFVTAYGAPVEPSLLARVHVLDITCPTDVSCLRPRRIALTEGTLDDIASLVYAERVDLVNCHVPFAGIAALRGLVTVELECSKLRAIPPELSRVHTLDLSHSGELTDVANGRGIHTLILRRCPRVVDVSALGKVHVLDLSYGTEPVRQTADLRQIGADWAAMRARDVAALGGVHTLVLSDNVRLVGVESLGNNHTLVLRNALNGWQRGDVAHLGRVHTLDLSHNLSVRTGKGLGAVHSLKLSCCMKLADVSALGNVHTLKLSACHRVTDISALGGVHTLSLACCRGLATLESFAVLGGVHTLDLSFVGWFANDAGVNITAEGLGKVHTLNLSATRVKDVSCLSRVHTLALNSCELVEDFSALGTVFNLSLAETNVRDVRGFGSVHALSLVKTPVSDVSSLGSVHTLNLSRCQNVVDVSALGYVHELDISFCEGIVDVSALGGVCVLDARRCSGLRDTSPLRTVKKLLL